MGVQYQKRAFSCPLIVAYAQQCVRKHATTNLQACIVDSSWQGIGGYRAAMTKLCNQWHSTYMSDLKAPAKSVCRATPKCCIVLLAPICNIALLPQPHKMQSSLDLHLEALAAVLTA